MENKIERIQRAHEVELRNIKLLAKNYCIEYFKTKANELTNIFTMEAFSILEKYTETKDTLNKREYRI